jgi:glycosyltransferase involved in cell wall biosynthesis
MKIGIDARGAIWYRGTGIGTYTFQLIKNLVQVDRKNDYRFFWPGDEFKDLDPSKDEIFNSIERSKDKFWEEVHIPMRVSYEGIDVYHVPQNGIGIPLEKRCPLIVTVHDLIPYVYPETVGRGYLKIFLSEMPKIMEQADRVITVSEHSKQDIKRIFKLPDERLRVIPEAPEDVYQPMDKRLASRFVRENYGIERPYILYVGGFSPRKNVKGLINAFYDLLGDLPEEYKLVIVGKEVRDFEDTALLAEALGLTDRVIFTGFVPVMDMPYLYNAAELFVYPSFYEGFGLPPLEAMACGTPVITTNVSSMPEICEGAALLVDPLHSLALAEAMYRMLTDEELRARLSQQGILRARSFSWRKTAIDTLAIYEEFIR